MTNIKNVENAGVKEILLWRFSATVLWSVLFQILILILCVFIVNISFINPLRWMHATVSVIVTPATLFYLSPLLIIIFAQGVICSKEYISSSTYFTTRFAKLINLLSIKNVWLASLHVLCGGLTSWCYVSLSGSEFSELYRHCEENNFCFVEEYVFLLLNGFWIGFYYFITEHLFTVNNIWFPITQQNKFLQIKSSLSSLMFKASSDTILPTLYFIFIYYFYGNLISNIFVTLFGLKEEDTSDSIIPEFMSTNLVLYAWLFSSLFLLAMYIMKLLFEINLTTHHTFPISTSVPGTITIGKAITMREYPIIQHLACFDLFTLAGTNRNRRNMIFVLSQPGGHPYNWNSIVTPSLDIINEFASELIKTTEDSKTVIDNVKATKLADSSMNVLSSISNEPRLNITTSFYEPHISGPIAPRYRLRNMLLKTEYDYLTPSKPDDSKKTKESALVSVDTLFKNFVSWLLKKPGINYLFGEQSDMKIRHILLRGQLIIWTAQALSWLATHSFNEDNYGVVQKDLPIIISTLLKLKIVLDKVSKSGFLSVNRKINQNKKDHFYIQMLTALKSAIKRSLYNICNTFGPYMTDIPLDAESANQLKMFLLYKEG